MNSGSALLPLVPEIVMRLDCLTHIVTDACGAARPTAARTAFSRDSYARVPKKAAT